MQAFVQQSAVLLISCACMGSFSACMVAWDDAVGLRADTLLSGSRRLAPGAVDWAVRHTLFRHFCGGECVESIQPTLQVRPLTCAL